MLNTPNIKNMKKQVRLGAGCVPMKFIILYVLIPIMFESNKIMVKIKLYIAMPIQPRDNVVNNEANKPLSVFMDNEVSYYRSISSCGGLVYKKKVWR